MIDHKTRLLTIGGICLILGLFMIFSPIASPTIAEITKRNADSIQSFSAFIALVGGVVLYLGIRAKSGS